MKTYFLYMMQKKNNPLLKLPYERNGAYLHPLPTVPFLPEAEPEMPKKGKGKGKEEGKGHFQREDVGTLGREPYQLFPGYSFILPYISHIY